MHRLSEKFCVITGAARGIGKAIAQAFIQEGATVLLTDYDAEELAKVGQELDSATFVLDVKEEADWDRLADLHPTADVVVNNAGITGFEKGPAPHDPENASLEDWRDVHRVNLDGTFMGCRYAIRAMKEKGAGSVINISSRSGMVGIPGAAAYASSKAAIRNHSKSVALYCAQLGWDIRCNSIHPAAIMTPMWEPMLGDGEQREAAIEALVKDTPLRRFGEADEVASVAVLLASDEARYITGAEMTIDGGILAGSAAAPGS
ncbi:SDR family oxidoreductase [Parasphingorhabdus cellanae]|uniref:SDR family oxidoreductase n=1 Tax=Parasphingorhabdus cellanae TaxID=2806553 RepID=A0ABX7T7R5_9SPHN|nr:SDR family oxidoreductase [Parasphingorhabdus cellanae]QTD55978.1 SDR family oxidoreductase [Parasphingorhabdus cellanae]